MAISVTMFGLPIKMIVRFALSIKYRWRHKLRISQSLSSSVRRTLVTESPFPGKTRTVVSKSLARLRHLHGLLMATLFWALWDEDFGQRPWKDLSARVEAAIPRT